MAWLCVLSAIFALGTASARDGKAQRQPEDAGRNLQLRRLGVADGLSQAAVNAIVQDRQGFIWLGTQEGLNRFDGVQILSYSHDPTRPDSLGHDWVWDMLVDRAGALWVGTDGGGLSRFERAAGRFVNLRHRPGDPHSLPGDRVRALLQDRDGQIWIGTDGAGLARLDPASLEIRRYRHDPDDPHGLSHDRVMGLFEDRRGTLWVATDGGGLLRWNPAANRFKAYRHDPDDPETIGSDRVRAIFEAEDGRLWIGTTDAGLSMLEPSRRRFRRFPPDAHGRGAPLGPIRDIAQDQDGTVWIASAGGLCEWLPRSESFNCYREDVADPKSLPDNRVTQVYQDRGGVLWIGTYKGAASWNYVSDAFRDYGKRPDDGVALSEDVITSIDEDSEGGLWIGTYGGGLNRLDPARGRVQVWRHDPEDPQSLASDRVMAVHVGADGQVWVGSRSSGLSRLDPVTGSVLRYRHDADDPHSLGGDGITRIAGDPDGSIWIGSYGGGLSHLDPDNGRFRVYRHDPDNPRSLSSDRVLAVLHTSDGQMLVGTEDGGLNEGSGSAGFAHHRFDAARPDSLSSDTAWDLLEAGDGSLWIATSGGGLSRWLAEDRRVGRSVFQRYDKRNGLVSNSIMAVLEDDVGAIWISGNNGLSRLDPDSGAVRHFDTSNGLKSNDFTQGARARAKRGELAFGGSQGLVLFHPREIRANRHPPQVAVQVMSPRGVLGRAYSSSDEPARIDASFRDYTISFELAALDFTSPDKNRFRYQLQGFDRDWISSGPFRRATYTNLPARSYRFRVEATNSDGIRSERSADVILRVRPPPWRSLWAYCAYLLLAITVIGLYLRAHGKKLRWEAAQRQLLEAKVRQRTQELSERNLALEALNEQLKQASVTDALTGLKNRRYFYEAIEPEASMIRRLYTDLAPPVEIDSRISLVPFLFFMMIDLDGFKLINDTYGHQAGDAALRQVRDLLRRCCRNSDSIIRWGEDKFLVFGRSGGHPAAEKLAERVRRDLADHQYQLGDGKIGRLSGSIGLAAYPMVPGKPDLVDWETVLAIADQASYIARRNQCNAWVAIYATGRGFKADTPMRIKQDLAGLIEQGVMRIETSITKDLHTLSDKTEAVQV